jgi:hypothetical protein
LITVNLPESRVLQIWQDCPGRNDLETEEDGPVKVLYPGRINDDSGADFRDAVIQTRQGRFTGDIEIHTKSSLWWAHRHHLDPLYNRVILHVVFRHDMAKSIILENGRSAPTLALERIYGESDGQCLPAEPVIPCRRAVEKRDIGILLGVLDKAGEQRFQSRAAGFQTVASPAEAGQALYRGIMGALGYSKNKHPMMALACRMPLRRLETMVAAETPDTECLAICQAMLTGAAGLLPSQRARRRVDDENNRWIDGLERLWVAAGEAVMMSERDWHFFRIRPGNFPTRRIAAMSRLLLRYREEGLLTGLIGEFHKLPVDGGCRGLEEALIIEAGDCHSTVSKGESALLGRERAADIVINVLLPFAVAWGRVNSRPELAEKAVNLYRRYPALATNTLERHMGRQFGIDVNLVNTARRQQGLLHIFKTLCSVGGCRICPMNQAA